MAERSFAKEVVDASRSQFALPRKEVEDDIKKWHEPVPPPLRDPYAAQIPETRKYPPGARPAPARPPAQAYGDIPRENRVEGGVRAPSQNTGSERYSERPTVQYKEGSDVQQRPAAPYRPKEEVHQPFRDQFSDLGKSTDEPRISPPVVAPPPPVIVRPRAPEAPSQAQGERTPQRESGVPLSLLKSSPKKDKGPSEQNLSSLRDALSAVLVSKETKKEADIPKAGDPPERETRAYSHQSSALRPPQAPTVSPESRVLPLPPPLPTPRSPLLDSPFTPPPPSEIPEEVLKKVLAD